MPGSVLMCAHGNKRARFRRYGKLSLDGTAMDRDTLFTLQSDIRRQSAQLVRGSCRLFSIIIQLTITVRLTLRPNVHPR
jgi:hypothetical protein